jgi:hypothetical protein
MDSSNDLILPSLVIICGYIIGFPHDTKASILAARAQQFDTIFFLATLYEIAGVESDAMALKQQIDAAIPRQADTPWLRHVGGDGDLNRFVDGLGVLLNFDNTNTKLGMAIWDQAANRFPKGPGSVIPADGNAAGVFPTSVELVTKPAFRSNGQLMYAATGSTADGLIHGLFAADPTVEHPVSDVKLTKLGSVGGVVTAIGSLDGSTLMAGTDSGKIFSLDSASGAVSPHALPDVAGDGVVSRIAM